MKNYETFTSLLAAFCLQQPVQSSVPSEPATVEPAGATQPTVPPSPLQCFGSFR